MPVQQLAYQPLPMWRRTAKHTHTGFDVSGMNAWQTYLIESLWVNSFAQNSRITGCEFHVRREALFDQYAVCRFEFPARYKAEQMVFQMVIDPIGCDKPAFQVIGKCGAGVAQTVVSVAGDSMLGNIANAAKELKPGQ